MTRHRIATAAAVALTAITTPALATSQLEMQLFDMQVQLDEMQFQQELQQQTDFYDKLFENNPGLACAYMASRPRYANRGPNRQLLYDFVIQQCREQGWIK